MQEVKESSVKRLNLKEVLSTYGIVFVLVIMVILISIIKPQFLSRSNLLNVLTQSCIFGIMALGVTPVIIAKGIDLSLGSIVAFSGLVLASLSQIATAGDKMFEGLPQLPIIVPIIACLLVGMLCCGFSGFLVAKTGIPAFIATLGMTTIVRGACLIYSGGKPLTNFQPALIKLGGTVGGFPVPVIIYIICIIVTFILLNHTRFGTDAYAIGGNINAAEVSGINISKAIISVFAFCGIMCGVAAVVFAGRVQSVHPGAAKGYELTAIAATTIGGTSQSGGIGTIWGAVVGALVLGVLRNGMTLLGLDAYWQEIVEGAIIIGAVIIDMRKNAVKK
ncbi:ABC transporter permease [Faecalicatena contorta]|uniref:Monosaccharide ABC transporter membrane protein, CUT2 family n=1 Tax=Faecalicatena contorta TaxID=39482 RepID=A0A315ZYN7_9FIRM|nr:ABC transporter permease [Faecalicatena contorta]PWJ50771.1 monosaccharide ABC transporter membrane protein (CUT2 family) [Faecalicatena contorta]SUQ13339.1 monosaccharide ABC transporter membrane protein, CUT2 family [Faecalicatena contorta]